MKPGIWIGDREFPTVRAAFDAWRPGDEILVLNDFGFTVCAEDSSSEPSPLDRVKSAILELPKNSQHEIYKFLHTLGHRMF